MYTCLYIIFYTDTFRGLKMNHYHIVPHPTTTSRPPRLIKALEKKVDEAQGAYDSFAELRSTMMTKADRNDETLGFGLCGIFAKQLSSMCIKWDAMPCQLRLFISPPLGHGFNIAYIYMQIYPQPDISKNRYAVI